MMTVRENCPFTSWWTVVDLVQDGKLFVFFVFDKQNDAEQNLLLHYPIFAQIDCTLLLTLMPFYFTEGHFDLIVFFCTVHKTNPRLRLLQQLPNSAFEIWAIVKETSHFHASLESSPSNCILLVSLHSDCAQWIHCRAWCYKKVHLIKKPITPKCFVQFVWFIKAIVHLFFCEKKTNSRFSRRKLFASVVLMCAHGKWHKISTVPCLRGKWVLKMKYNYIIHVLWSIASSRSIKTTDSNCFP